MKKKFNLGNWKGKKMWKWNIENEKCVYVSGKYERLKFNFEILSLPFFASTWVLSNNVAGNECKLDSYKNFIKILSSAWSLFFNFLSVLLAINRGSTQFHYFISTIMLNPAQNGIRKFQYLRWISFLSVSARFYRQFTLQFFILEDFAKRAWKSFWIDGKASEFLFSGWKGIRHYQLNAE